MSEKTISSKTIGAELSYTTVPEAAAIKFVDTIEIDQEGHRLYAGDNWSGGVDVFDISSPEAKFLKTVRIRGTFYGVCVVKDLAKVFVGLSGSRVAVIDIDPNSATADTVVATMSTGGTGNADLIDYDPIHKKIYIANRNEGFLASIDAVKNVLLKKIDGLGGGLEQPRFNPADGMLYLAGNTDDVLYQIDPATDTLVNTFLLDEDCHPNGLAINPASGQALLACANRQRPHTVFFDLKEQKIASVVEETGSGDGATYDPTIDRFFFAASGWKDGPVVGIFGGNPARFIANVPTGRMASWVAYDRTNRLVYTPTIRDGMPALLSFPLPEA
jgi:DNA-binding beta-propeller fold protein YncE